MQLSAPVQRFRFGLFEVHPDSGELRRSGHRLRLQEQPFQVLLALLERPGEIVTREDLRQRLWSSDTFVDFDHSLNTAINKLRETLGDTAQNPRFIETLPRRGYRFIAPVEAVGQAPPSPAPLPAQNGPAGAAPLPHAERRTSRLLFGLLQFMYLVFYAIAMWRLDEAGWRTEARFAISGGYVEAAIVLFGGIGVVVRLYTLNAVLFDYPQLGGNFQRIFALVLLLDIAWALSPFLLVHLIGMGLAIACCAALVYSPFAQRMLALMAYPPAKK